MAPHFDTDSARADLWIARHAAKDTMTRAGKTVETDTRGTSLSVRPAYSFGPGLGAAALALTYERGTVDQTDAVAQAKRKTLGMTPSIGYLVEGFLPLGLALEYWTVETHAGQAKETYTVTRAHPTIGSVGKMGTILFTYVPRVEVETKVVQDGVSATRKAELSSRALVTWRRQMTPTLRLIGDLGYDLADAEDEVRQRPQLTERLQFLVGVSTDRLPKVKRATKRRAAKRVGRAWTLSAGLMRKQTSLPGLPFPYKTGTAPTTGPFVHGDLTLGGFDVGFALDYAAGQVKRDDPTSDEPAHEKSWRANVAIHSSKSF